MKTMSTTAIAEQNQVEGPLSFSAVDVTGTHEIDFDGVDGHRLTADVARTVAEAMDLPSSIPWALRDEANARMLQDDEPLGRQLRPGGKVVVIPRSHLG
jgi:hypothetical protein